MPGVVVAPRPSHRPDAAASSHQPSATKTSVLSSLRPAPTMATTASAVAAPPNSSTRCAGSRGSASVGRERLEHAREAVDAVHHQVGALDDRRRALVRAHADAHAPRRGRLPRAARRARRRRRGRSRRRRRRARRAAPAPRHQLAHGLALVDRHRRPDLQHLAAPVDREPAGLRLLRDPSRQVRAASSSGTPRQWKAMIGPLSSIRTRSSRSSRRVALGAKRRTRLSQLAKAGTTRGLVLARARAARRRGSRRRRSRRRPPAGAPRPPSAPRRRPRSRSGARAGPSRTRAPPRARAASSARSTIGASVPSMSQKTPALRGVVTRAGAAPPRARLRWERTPAVVCPRCPRGSRASPRSPRRRARSAGCSASAAAPSSCPLLVLWLGYEQREATGTSLAAIVRDRRCSPRRVQAAYGNVDLVKGLLIGAPAIGGRGGRHGAPAADPRAGGVAGVRGAARGLGGDPDLLSGRRGPHRPDRDRLRRRDGRRPARGGRRRAVRARPRDLPRTSRSSTREATSLRGDRARGGRGRLAPARLRQPAPARTA